MAVLTAQQIAQLDQERREAAVRGLPLATVVDAWPNAVISAGADGLITTWNPAAEKLYGYAEEEVIGHPVTVLGPPAKVGPLDVSIRDLRPEEPSLGDQREEKARAGRPDLARSRAETLRSLALAAEYRHYDTALHTERVGAISARLAVELDLPARLVAMIVEAAPLHDVGKIGIPDRILLKPGTLTEAESSAMRQHTILGARILAGNDGEVLRLAEQIALTHHENWDGNGYPAGLAGEAIPLAGRIVAVADALDAITHDRPYRPAAPVEVALTEISRGSGSQFDPLVVEAVLRIYR